MSAKILDSMKIRDILQQTFKANRKTMNRNWSNQKPNPALKLQIEKQGSKGDKHDQS